MAAHGPPVCKAVSNSGVFDRAGPTDSDGDLSDTEGPLLRSTWSRGPSRSFSKSRSEETIELDPEKNARAAAGKAISILMKMEDGYCMLERESVYGAAVALPQIARSAGWPKRLVGLSIRVYILLSVNFFLQAFLVCVINEEAIVMRAYSGQMHLCDFGAGVEQCPGGPHCVGPGGTQISGPRLTSYADWSTRSFVRDSLKAIFPDKAEEIEQKVDPGEYGIENWWCRMVCCFLFMMAVVDDLRAAIEMGYLLKSIPVEESFWIRYEMPAWAEKDVAKAVHGWGELDMIKYQIRGMPRKWKIINAVCILIPKFALWYAVTSAGIRFLMETSGIVDLVVNAMALTFVLDMDEIVLERLGTVATKHMMERLEPWPLFDTDREEHESMEEAYERPQHEDNRLFCSVLVYVPSRIIFLVLLMLVFVAKYYVSNCDLSEDGVWVSKDLYLPSRVSWDPISLLTTNTDDYEPEPFWTMPL